MIDGAGQRSPRRIGVAVKVTSPEAVHLGQQVLADLRQRGVEGVADRESAPFLGVAAGPPRAELGAEVDVVLVLGGDGTFLSVSRGCPASTPVAGINLGTLGFLTEHAPSDTFALLEAILAGQIVTEQRARLRATVDTPQHRRELLALNDVVVTKSALARILSIIVEVGGEVLTRLRADGLILATPTGSTAYNLSAGGPVVHPSLNALLVTPICSHGLTHRPLVIPLDLPVQVWVEDQHGGGYLTVDGQLGVPLPTGVVVEIGPSPQPLTVIREAGSTFFTTLHHKLKWGERSG